MLKKRQKFKNWSFLACFLSFFFICNNVFALQLKNLTILAEPNMTNALTKIARIYSQRNGIVISVSFASSAELIEDIEEGEPSDVFISAHRYWIDNLKQKGLVDIYSIEHIADDSLVLVTSKRNQKIPIELISNDLSLVGALQTLNDSGAALVVDHEGSSLGQYSEYLLKNLELSNLRVFKRLVEDKNSIANILENNPENYSLLLASQIQNNDDLRVLSSFKNQHIFYQALVIAGDNMDNARKFLRFLRSRQAKKIFEESGFIVEN